MTGDREHVETVIIGGGHAGLTMSHSLSQLGQEHVILERGRVGERWRSERWDSFHFQFPNWTIELPGYKYQCDDPDAFAPAMKLCDFWMATPLSSKRQCVVESRSPRWSGAHARGDI